MSSSKIKITSSVKGIIIDSPLTVSSDFLFLIFYKLDPTIFKAADTLPLPVWNDCGRRELTNTCIIYCTGPCSRKGN